MISCQQYDYVEIACMYRYPIKLTMKSGNIIEGIAVDTARNKNNEECIKIIMDGNEILLVLDDIAQLKVTQKNPYFNTVSLK